MMMVEWAHTAKKDAEFIIEYYLFISKEGYPSASESLYSMLAESKYLHKKYSLEKCLSMDLMFNCLSVRSE